MVGVGQSAIDIELRGQGRDLVLLHSLLSDRTAFDRIAPRLARERRVVLVNLPGFGASAPAGPGLEDFADRFGAFASSQISLRFVDLAQIPRLMDRLRANLPTAVGGVRVARIDDFERGFGDFGANDILRIWLDDGSRIVIRPSGTEPKLKVYIDASSTVGSAQERMDAAAAAVEVLDAGMRKLLV